MSMKITSNTVWAYVILLETAGRHACIHSNAYGVEQFAVLNVETEKVAGSVYSNVAPLTNGFPVIPALVVHPLPQELDRRLCSVHLHGWHVEVINKKDKMLAQRRTKHSLASVKQARGREGRREVESKARERQPEITCNGGERWVTRVKKWEIRSDRVGSGNRVYHK